MSDSIIPCPYAVSGTAHNYTKVGSDHRSTQTMCCTNCGDTFMVDLKTGQRMSGAEATNPDKLKAAAS